MNDDHAKRAFDFMNLQVMSRGEEAWGLWCAFRLSDGVGNGPYITRQEAIKAQLHPSQSCYLVIPPSGFSLPELREFLNLSRKLYDLGARIPSHGEYRRMGWTV